MHLGPFDCDDSLKALKTRLATFNEVWPFLEDCNCTPEKVKCETISLNKFGF